MHTSVLYSSMEGPCTSGTTIYNMSANTIPHCMDLCAHDKKCTAFETPKLNNGECVMKTGYCENVDGLSLSSSYRTYLKGRDLDCKFG